MNLAVHGLSGDVRESNTYYEDPHKAVGRFDFVMANPPFNVSGVDKERIKDDPRFPFGIPTTDNANYLWIQLFYSALNATGRAGFVMANSAGDARGAELEIRKKLIQTGGVDAIVSVGPNFFYTVTLPCTLWFFDKAKAQGNPMDQGQCQPPPGDPCQGIRPTTLSASWPQDRSLPSSWSHPSRTCMGSLGATPGGRNRPHTPPGRLAHHCQGHSGRSAA